MDTSALSFYAIPKPMNAIDHAAHGWALEGLPTDPAGLAAAVRGVLIHRDWAPVLGVQFARDRIADEQLRSVRSVITRILELSHLPLRTERALPDRMVGVCRHFATLYASLLREHGIPARARARVRSLLRERMVRPLDHRTLGRPVGARRLANRLGLASQRTRS